jgi:Na+/H+ antiporter NhaD/arsenite permease-like protein
MAGNLTILGSVANLLVAEAAKSQGMEIGFMDFLKAGFFSSIISIVLTVFWLQLLM